MGTTQLRKEGETARFESGIYRSHVYSVLGVATLKKSKERLVKIRNPHGQDVGNYVGKYSNKSRKANGAEWRTLTSSERRKIKADWKNGFFYMTLEEYYLTFMKTTVALDSLNKPRAHFLRLNDDFNAMKGYK